MDAEQIQLQLLSVQREKKITATIRPATVDVSAIASNYRNQFVPKSGRRSGNACEHPKWDGGPVEDARSRRGSGIAVRDHRAAVALYTTLIAGASTGKILVFEFGLKALTALPVAVPPNAPFNGAMNLITANPEGSRYPFLGAIKYGHNDLGPGQGGLTRLATFLGLTGDWLSEPIFPAISQTLFRARVSDKAGLPFDPGRMGNCSGTAHLGFRFESSRRSTQFIPRCGENVEFFYPAERERLMKRIQRGTFVRNRNTGWIRGTHKNPGCLLFLCRRGSSAPMDDPAANFYRRLRAIWVDEEALPRWMIQRRIFTGDSVQSGCWNPRRLLTLNHLISYETSWLEALGFNSSCGLPTTGPYTLEHIVKLVLSGPMSARGA
ncbi:hypothetical protein C8R47DRAFT_1084151 [Mycena vitilis]|nr:hypothetical protein C8R47DRAFT_1084151 [Mycena vitilis]